ncbi:phosphate/phosphite/phosphonate ABC transporter substrate-binding protein [Clostridium pasteurianum]|uniref:ABC-type phosphate/phosphonate transport system, periplasmic component n=1 Tax=Clostridium pasteurianum BC1 TaxID=86416 RepID=R4K9E4_CLOPA|nr:phosphate/phosphite/phosphonate ABC transporter substrate-binding protein [Clostridium pasteurianum]AGK98321.1 ABC-type phosphate/phosphonate transport system, periplasmic component [Clostridium pasteurianum BC1]
MKKLLLVITNLIIAVAVLAGCSGSGASNQSGDNVKPYDTINVVWYPNESAADYKDARDEVCKIIADATGKKVEQQTTTDYSIAIEAIASGKGQIAFMGGQGYVEAHTKNAKILPLVVNTGASGTLDDAIYYSWLSVNKGDESQYQKDGKYTLDNIQGKKMSYVSNSSTSGFKVPTTNIVSYFSKTDKWKNIKVDDLSEGGSDKFFKEVLFGQSHQVSAANLLNKKADVAAFCDTALAPYVDVETGKANTVGAVYKVKADASDPFTNLRGKEYVLISVTPVLNGPFAVNTGALNKDDIDKIQTALTSDTTANDSKIYYKKGSKGLIEKTKNEHFTKVDDSWYNPIRELSK